MADKSVKKPAAKREAAYDDARASHDHNIFGALTVMQLILALALLLAVVAMLPMVEGKKKPKPAAPERIYYVNQTAPVCTKKTTVPQWACTPSPYKFFTYARLVFAPWLTLSSWRARAHHFCFVN